MHTFKQLSLPEAVYAHMSCYFCLLSLGHSPSSAFSLVLVPWHLTSSLIFIGYNMESLKNVKVFIVI